MGRDRKKRVSIAGPWQPIPLDFLRARACAELSPHAAKLLLDVLGMLGPNATRNGDICLTPRLMRLRGWPGRQTLSAAVEELEAFGLLFRTRQGSRLDCSLWACALFPLDCDLSKLDERPGAYRTSDWMMHDTMADKPTEAAPATWRRARKTQTLAPPRDDKTEQRPATGRTRTRKPSKSGTSSRHGTKTPESE